MSAALGPSSMLGYAVALVWAGIWIIAGVMNLLSRNRDRELSQPDRAIADKRRRLVGVACILVSPGFLPMVTQGPTPWSFVLITVMFVVAGTLLWFASKSKFGPAKK
jgi:hypothetical protein